MRSVYLLFDELNKSSDYALSTRTLASVKDFYFGYLRGLQDGGIEIDDGDPPFSQFSNWLARRFGKSKPSLMGKWTRYDGGWWRIIEEQSGVGEAGFRTFFDLLSEFRQRTKCVVSCSKTPISVANIDSASEIARLEALHFPPEQGYYLNIIYLNGKIKVDGFYSSVDELKASAQKQFNVSLFPADEILRPCVSISDPLA